MASKEPSIPLDRRQLLAATAAFGATLLPGCPGTMPPPTTTTKAPCPEGTTKAYPGADLEELTEIYEENGNLNFLGTRKTPEQAKSIWDMEIHPITLLPFERQDSV